MAACKVRFNTRPFVFAHSSGGAWAEANGVCDLDVLP